MRDREAPMRESVFIRWSTSHASRHCCSPLKVFSLSDISCSCLVFPSLNFDHWENSSRSLELRNVLNAKDLVTGSVNRNRTNLPVIITTQATIRVYSHVCAGARLTLSRPNDLWENSIIHLSNRACTVRSVEESGLGTKTTWTSLALKIIATKKVA